MNIQQLHYVLAVDQHRHFQKAAEACFVTPATLSIMLKKLEEELDVIIFDRSKHPIVPTEMGKIVIDNARTILAGVSKMQYEVKYSAEKSIIKGELRIGIIPTLAPYLIHLFLPKMIQNYPQLRIQLKELRTQQITDYLRKDRIDVGIIALQDEGKEFQTRSLFMEKLLVFSPESIAQASHHYILSEDIDPSKLWLLEEEHCLRSQVLNLCSLKKVNAENEPLKFEAGSIETLVNLVEMTNGITVIPELAIRDFSAKRKAAVRRFAAPEPAREIGMITYRHLIKERLINVLEEEITRAVQPILHGVIAHPDPHTSDASEVSHRPD